MSEAEHSALYIFRAVDAGVCIVSKQPCDVRCPSQTFDLEVKMADTGLGSAAALQAQDKELLTRDWIDRHARKSKHPRPGENAGVKVRFWPFPSYIYNDVATVATQADGATRYWAVTDRRKRKCLQ